MLWFLGIDWEYENSRQIDSIDESLYLFFFFLLFLFVREKGG